VIGNHFSHVVDAAAVRPAGATPVVMRLLAGGGNFVSTNHVVALDVPTKPNGSAFSGQVEALLTTEAVGILDVTTVLVDPASTGNTILDSGTEEQLAVDVGVNAVRASPAVPVSG
jgi:hypothetical protein